MQVKTNVFLSEEDVRLILRKHLEKVGYKVIGELNIGMKRIKNIESLEVSVEVQKQFKNRIELKKGD